MTARGYRDIVPSAVNSKVTRRNDLQEVFRGENAAWLVDWLPAAHLWEFVASTKNNYAPR